MTVRVGIVDDSDIMRRGLLALLGTDPEIDVIGQAGDGDEAIELVKNERPDVLLLDVRMPRRDGLSIVKEIADQTRILMLTFTDDDASIQRALADGAAGYLIHGTFDADSLAHMVRATASGAAPFSQAALRAVQQGPVSGSAPASDQDPLGLSPRQAEVMDLIAEGRSNSDIAGHLFLAEKTVKNHINQIFAILGVTSRAEAIVRWLGR
ncbi:response regulator [Knoellia subterranea]|uniref:Response regulator receiver n=1 Tax=Knoellia subterranea KCTC 19937 TaxID=1385521 RepID=A0A0A0JME4_9MICO|nr:response regulator transcription factor [Knoellia subterranea]KGN38313.1 response regulator receiver [Knoellia subterranea KCTC 19937]